MPRENSSQVAVLLPVSSQRVPASVSSVRVVFVAFACVSTASVLAPIDVCVRTCAYAQGSHRKDEWTATPEVPPGVYHRVYLCVRMRARACAFFTVRLEWRVYQSTHVR